MKTYKIDNESKIATGFSTPENYFDDFSSKVLFKVNNKETKIVSFYSKRKNWLYACAAILILGLMIPIYKYVNNPMSKIDDQSLENYIVYSSTISNDEIVSLLDYEDIETLNIKLNIEEKTIENELTNTPDLEQYFLN